MAARNLLWGLHTDVGRVRKLNEDGVAALTIPLGPGLKASEALVGIVADGMGGHEAGEVASRIGIATFTSQLRERLRNPRASRGNLPSLLNAAVQAAHEAIRAHVDCRPDLDGMGTTFTAALIVGDEAYVAHVGDSRAYLVVNGRVRQLTSDHTLVADQVRAGILSPAEARQAPNSNVLSQALGAGEDITVEVFSHRLPDRFSLILATDGAYSQLTNEDFLQAAAGQPTPQATCAELVRRNKLRDGSDNLTAVCLRGGASGVSSLSGGRRALVSTLAVVAALAVVLAVCMAWPPRQEVAGPFPPPTTATDTLLSLKLTRSATELRLDARSPDKTLFIEVGDLGEWRCQKGDDTSSKTYTLPSADQSGSGARTTAELMISRASKSARGDAQWRLQRIPDRITGKGYRGLRADDKLLPPTKTARTQQADGKRYSGTLDWPPQRLRFHMGGQSDLPITIDVGHKHRAPKVRREQVTPSPPEITEPAPEPKTKSRGFWPWRTHPERAAPRKAVSPRPKSKPTSDTQPRPGPVRQGGPKEERPEPDRPKPVNTGGPVEEP